MRGCEAVARNCGAIRRARKRNQSDNELKKTPMVSDQVSDRETERSWGDTVRVRPDAPAPLRPGMVAEIVGIRTIETTEQSAEFRTAIGSKLYLVEFSDAEAIEVPGRWLASFDPDAHPLP